MFTKKIYTLVLLVASSVPALAEPRPEEVPKSAGWFKYKTCDEQLTDFLKLPPEHQTRWSRPMANIDFEIEFAKRKAFDKKVPIEDYGQPLSTDLGYPVESLNFEQLVRTIRNAQTNNQLLTITTKGYQWGSYLQWPQEHIGEVIAIDEKTGLVTLGIFRNLTRPIEIPFEDIDPRRVDVYPFE